MVPIFTQPGYPREHAQPSASISATRKSSAWQQPLASKQLGAKLSTAILKKKRHFTTTRSQCRCLTVRFGADSIVAMVLCAMKTTSASLAAVAALSLSLTTAACLSWVITAPVEIQLEYILKAMKMAFPSMLSITRTCISRKP